MEIDELYTVEHHNKGAEMQLDNQFGEKIDCYITFVGIDSEVFRKILADSRRELIETDGKDKESIRANSLSSAALSWRGFLSKKKNVEFSQKKLKKLLLSAPYIMDQADKFIANRVNFTKS
jgi:hypothetical protein